MWREANFFREICLGSLATAYRALIFAIFVDIDRPRSLSTVVAVKSGLEVNQTVQGIAVRLLVGRWTTIVHDGFAVESGINAALLRRIESGHKAEIQPDHRFQLRRGDSKPSYTWMGVVLRTIIPSRPRKSVPTSAL